MNEVMENTAIENEELVLELDGEVVETAEVTETETAAEIKTETEFTFKPGEFVANLKYMGLGMLGIFVVIGIIIIVTSVLSKIKTKDAE